MTRETKKHNLPSPPAHIVAAAVGGSPESLLARWTGHAAASVVTIFLLVLVGVMSRWPLMWAGDNYTDANVLMAGENFARLGFWKLHFLPVHYFTPSADNPIYYLHYPPLDQWVNGALQSFGMHSVYLMRLFCGTLFVAGLLAMYRAFVPLIGPLAAVCGLALAGTSGFFVGYATSLHHSYNILFLGAFLLFFLPIAQRENPSGRSWLGAWIALLLASLVSYEFILYAQIFAWVYVCGTGRLRTHWKALLLLATAPILGVGLHFLQNCWAVGLSATLADGFGYKPYGEESRWNWLRQLPAAVSNRSGQRFFWAWPALLLGTVLLSRSERVGPDPESRRRIVSLLLGTLLAPLGWYLAMTRHVVIHAHTAGQLLPLVFVVLGCAAAWSIGGLFARRETWPVRVLAGCALVALITGQVQTVQWRIEECKPTVVEFIQALGSDVLPPKTAVLHNTSAPHFAYFMRHPAWRALTDDQLHTFPGCIPDLQSHLPPDWKLQYYVFFGTGDRDTFRILASSCPGRRLAQLGSYQIVLFDLGEMLRPEAERTPLDPALRERQLRNEFPNTPVPGFVERLAAARAQFPERAQN